MDGSNSARIDGSENHKLSTSSNRAPEATCSSNVDPIWPPPRLSEPSSIPGSCAAAGDPQANKKSDRPTVRIMRERKFLTVTVDVPREYFLPRGSDSEQLMKLNRPWGNRM